MLHRMRTAGLFVLAYAAVSCTDAPSNPSAATGSIALSPTFSESATRIYTGLAAFGIELTEVHIALTGPDGSTKDTTIAFPPSVAQIAIDIPIPSSGVDKPFNALIELCNDQHVVLFSGRQVVIARASYLSQMSSTPVVIEYTGPGKDAKTITVSATDTIVAGQSAVSLKATALDAANKLVPDLLVAFSISDASLGSATSIGNSSATLTGLGRRGVATVTAINPLGVSGSSRITFVPGAARVLVISGDAQTGVAGSVLAHPLVVQVQATDNLPVPGATVAFRSVTPGGEVHNATAIADTAGRATTTLTLGKAAGTYRYEAATGSIPAASVTAIATSAPPAALTIVSGNGQTGVIGRTLGQPLVVVVTDQFGGVATGATIAWARVGGTGTLSAATTVSATDGKASISYTLGNITGTESVRATLVGVNNPAGSVLFSLTAVNPPAAIAIVSGGNQTGLPGTTLPQPIVVRVTDAQNNPFGSATVIWSATGAGARFSPATSLTDVAGHAATLVTLGAAVGPTTITATVGSLTATTTLTTVGPPTLSIVAGDQQKAKTGAPVAIAPSVLLKDALGNPLANVPVVFAVVSGGGSITGASTTTNAAGVATIGSWTLGSTAGPNTLSATSGALRVIFSATALTPEVRREPSEGHDHTRDGVR